MKKFIAAFFLLICGLVVLLATIDLEQFLVSGNTTTLSTKSATNDQIVPQAKNIEETDQTKPTESDGLVKNGKPAPPIVEVYPEQEQVVTPPKETMVHIAEEVIMEQIPSSLIELEVTALPVGEYPFSILLDTFLGEETAQKAISFYQARGISAHWVKVNLEEKGLRYRLFTGIFSTVPEAQQYLDHTHLVDKPIKPTYYAARVGVYTDKAALANAFVKTSAAGVVPYILGTKKGDYFLYVGAFYTYIGAIAQCRDLTNAGLNCEPVKRSTIPPQ